MFRTPSSNEEKPAFFHILAHSLFVKHSVLWAHEVFLSYDVLRPVLGTSTDSYFRVSGAFFPNDKAADD